VANKNVNTLRSAHEKWNRRDFDGVVSNLTDTCVYVDHALGRRLNGKHAFQQYVENWAEAMTDGRITDAHYYDAGDHVVVEFTGEGTNDGPFAGFPASNRHVSFAFCEIWSFDKNGRMTSGGCYYDLYSLLAQMGHTKPLATAA
jgi:steroid delta-isomerase-like uncharacterized protein